MTRAATEIRLSDELAPPAPAAERAGRLAICVSLLALLYALWDPNLGDLTGWTTRDFRGLSRDAICAITAARVLPRVSIFAVAGLIILILQGARPAFRTLLWWGLGLLGLELLLLSDSTAPQVLRRWGPFTGALQTLTRFELAALSAVLLGTALGRGLRTPLHFMTLLLCAIAGDVWLSKFHVADAAGAVPALSLLRLPWPVPTANLALTPGCLDLVVLAAALESARTLRFPVVSIVMGALAGYCGASFLALEPWPGWGALSMCMCSCGMLISCWPDLKCSLLELGAALLISIALLLALMGFTMLQRSLHPAPQNQEDWTRYRNVAWLTSEPTRRPRSCSPLSPAVFPPQAPPSRQS